MRPRLTVLVMAVGMSLAGPALTAGATTPASPSQQNTDPVGGPRLTGTDPVIDAAAPTPPPPKVRATGWLVADLDSGEVLATQGPHLQLRPAETQSALAALVLLPRLNTTGELFGTDADGDVAGSKVGIAPGVKYTVGQLFEAAFLAPAPDAVHALARYDDGPAGTVRRMTAKATALGALDTRVVDPAGVDRPGQVTSVYDLALIARAGLRHPDFARYAVTKKARLPQPDGTALELTNHNRLLWSYPGAIGVKSGYSTLARNTLIGAAERDGRRLVVTMLDANNGVTLAAAKLLDWAYANRTSLRPVGTLNTHGSTAVGPEDRGGGLTAKVILRATQYELGPLPVWVYATSVLLFAFAGWRLLVPARGTATPAATARGGGIHRRARARARRARRARR